MRNNGFTRISAVFIAVGGIVISGCSSSSVPAAVASASTVASTPASVPASIVPTTSAQVSGALPKAGTDLQTTKSTVGQVIVDAKGMAVYYFKSDVAGSGKSTCSGQCLTAWPAVVPVAATVTATGISGKLGEISRTDGTRQITVNGRPVYLFQGDKAPGDINGQDVKKVWFLVSPSGAQIGG
jgi:predicted lipoprotein with Yx(FWY)xxD motif